MKESNQARFIDASALGSDGVTTDVCVVGAGPAGITLARALAVTHRVVVLESGTIDNSHYPNDLDEVEYATNFGYRIDFKNRCRHLGGAANLWAGRLVPYQFDNDMDAEWGDLREKLPRYYPAAAATLGLPPDLLIDNPRHAADLVAYWADRTERFNRHSRHFGKAAFTVVYHATYTGEHTLNTSGLEAITCRTEGGGKFEVRARIFVLACGGIETARLLLLMARAQPTCFAALPALGRYIMDHPKITHGRVINLSYPSPVTEYGMEFLPVGLRQIGRRSLSQPIRVYCNLVPEKRPLVERLYSKAANLYAQLSSRYGRHKANHSDEIIYLLEPHEILPRALLLQLHRFDRLFNHARDNRNRRLVTYLEMRPRFHNRISLNEAKLDRFGNPLPRLELELHPEELAAVAGFYRELAVAFAPKAQIEFDEQYVTDPRHFTDASHHLGGARYSAVVEDSVLEQDFSVRGLPNCHILSTAAFPTGGVENPTFLLVAMAHYLAANLAHR
jgi:choline dehydrogenase-like flavoprotein